MAMSNKIKNIIPINYQITTVSFSFHPHAHPHLRYSNEKASSPHPLSHHTIILTFLFFKPMFFIITAYSVCINEARYPDCWSAEQLDDFCSMWSCLENIYYLILPHFDSTNPFDYWMFYARNRAIIFILLFLNPT